MCVCIYVYIYIYIYIYNRRRVLAIKAVRAPYSYILNMRSED